MFISVGGYHSTCVLHIYVVCCGWGLSAKGKECCRFVECVRIICHVLLVRTFVFLVAKVGILTGVVYFCWMCSASRGCIT